MNFDSIEAVLDFAIAGEIEAYQFYLDLAGKVEKPWMKKVFEDFAREELGHRAKLEGIKSGKFLQPTPEKVTDLKIADYTVDVQANPAMEYADALILAMKKEKAAFKLYNDLADRSPQAEYRDTFLALAQEEAKHKLRFELEYDDHVHAGY